MDSKFNGREEEIFEFLRDTCNSTHLLVTMFDLYCSSEDIHILMLARNYKQCPNCGWWVESFELVPEDEIAPDGYCGNCRVQINE